MLPEAPVPIACAAGRCRVDALEVAGRRSTNGLNRTIRHSSSQRVVQSGCLCYAVEVAGFSAAVDWNCSW